MPFPDQDLELTCEAALGADLTAAPSTWVWTDLSARVIDTPITITRGVVVGAGTQKTGAVTGLALLNDDGALTPHLMTSPYWPNIDLGTPVRLSIRTDPTPYLHDTFTRTGTSWGTPTTGPAWTSGAASTTNGTQGVITQPAVSTAVNRIPCTRRDTDTTYTITIPAVAAGALIATGPRLREDGTDYVWSQIVFGVGGTLQLRLTTNSGGVVTALTTVTVGTYTANSTWTCRTRLVGDHVQVKVWAAAGPEPAAWQLDYRLTTNLVAGTTMAMLCSVFTGNLNLPVTTLWDNIAITQPAYSRFEGYIADVQPTFRRLPDGSTHSVAQVRLGGVGTRLELRSAPALSPLRRSLQLAPVPPIAYWPLEDAAASTSAASAFEEQPAMTVSGPAVFSFATGEPDDVFLYRYGSTALCSIAAGAKLSAPVPVTANVTSWTVSINVQVYAALAGIGDIRILEWTTPSSRFNRWSLVNAASPNQYVLYVYDDTLNAQVLVATLAPAYTGLVGIDVTAEQNGPDIDVRIVVDSSVVGTGGITGTIGPVTRVTVNPDRANTTNSTSAIGIRFIAGHVMVHDIKVDSALPYYYDLNLTPPWLTRGDRAWAYEFAHGRILRLCTEERIPCRVLGDVYTSGKTMLGAQQEGAFTDLSRAAIDAESGGLILEEEFGYVHRPRTDRYNAPVDLTVDMDTYAYTGGTDPTQVLVPQLDARAANRWTVQRTGGSEATHAAPEPFRKRRGTISDRAVLDVAYDTDCAPHAQWRTHLSVDAAGARYPAFTVDLAANPDLIDDWLLCRISSRIQRTNQPTIAGFGVIDQVIDGITETISARNSGQGPSWTATLDCSPAAVWQVGVWEDDDSPIESGNTVLDVGVNTTATSWVMDSGGDPWVTGTVNLPAQMGAEFVTITNITGAGSSWTFTVIRSVNGVVASHTAGEPITLLNAGRWGL